MGNFRKNITTSGKVKNIQIHNGKFVDAETDEAIDLVDLLSKVYGEDNAFDLAVSMKEEEEIDVD